MSRVNTFVVKTLAIEERTCSPAPDCFPQVRLKCTEAVQEHKATEELPKGRLAC